MFNTVNAILKESRLGKERGRVDSSSKKARLVLNQVVQQGKPERWFAKIGRGPSKFHRKRVSIQNFMACKFTIRILDYH
jgi:hypothetical protein